MPARTAPSPARVSSRPTRGFIPSFPRVATSSTSFPALDAFRRHSGLPSPRRKERSSGGVPGRGELEQPVVDQQGALIRRGQAGRIHIDRERIERDPGEAARGARARPARRGRKKVGGPRGLPRGARARSKERGEEKRGG